MARGFTLLELILTLFILTLVAGLAFPGLGKGVDRLQLRAEVAAFSSFLRYAREQAVRRHEAHEVRVDPEAKLLTLKVSATEIERARRRLSPRVAIVPEAPGALTVSFSPLGLSSGGTFQLLGPDGQGYRISVDPLTGRVTNTRGS
jgi:prepilin-type N-terminal cleavage/methylation domain-containing protein